MRAAKAMYEDGRLTFLEGDGPAGRTEVIVVFPDHGEPQKPRDKDAGRRFVEKWSGILKGCDIENWKDQKAEDILRK